MVQSTKKPFRRYRHHDHTLHDTFSGLVFAIEIVSFGRIKLLMGEVHQKLWELWHLYSPEANFLKPGRLMRTLKFFLLINEDTELPRLVRIYYLNLIIEILVDICFIFNCTYDAHILNYI